MNEVELESRPEWEDWMETPEKTDMAATIYFQVWQNAVAESASIPKDDLLSSVSDYLNAKVRACTAYMLFSETLMKLGFTRYSCPDSIYHWAGDFHLVRRPGVPDFIATDGENHIKFFKEEE